MTDLSNLLNDAQAACGGHVYLGIPTNQEREFSHPCLTDNSVVIQHPYAYATYDEDTGAYTGSYYKPGGERIAMTLCAWLEENAERYGYEMAGTYEGAETILHPIT